MLILGQFILRQRAATHRLYNVPSIAFITLFAFLITISPCAQNGTWKNYITRPIVNAVSACGDDIWVATEWNGLVKINRKTGAKEFYNTSNSGLPGNSVRYLATTSDGNVWITTGKDLVRYDGSKWEVLTPARSVKPRMVPTSVTTDHLGGVWLGAFTLPEEFEEKSETLQTMNIQKEQKSRSGTAVSSPAPKKWRRHYCLLHLDGKVWRGYASNISTDGAPIVSIAEEGNGIMWMGTSGNGLIRFDGKNWSTYMNVLKEDYRTNRMAVTSGSVDYSGTDWSAGTQNYSGFPDNRIRALTIDIAGVVWICTSKGIVQFDGKNWKLYDDRATGFDVSDAGSITTDKHGTVWTGYRNGFAAFDGFTWKTYADIYVGEVFPTDLHVKSIAIDEDGTVWCGLENGILKYDNKKYVKVSTTTIPLTGFVTDIAVDSAGNKWFTTFGNVWKFDGKEWKAYRNAGFDRLENSFHSLVIDKRHNAWIGTDNGLMKFDGKNWSILKIVNSRYIMESVIDIALERNGTVWTAVSGTSLSRPEGGGMLCPGRYEFGLTRFYRGKWTVYDTSNSDFPCHYVSRVAAAPDGVLWVAAHNGRFAADEALLKYDGKKWTGFKMDSIFRHYRKPSIYSDNVTVSTITFDKKQNVWIGSSSGIAKYDGARWTVYDSTNSMLRNVYHHCIAIDTAGNKWIASSYALIRFNDTTWTAYTSDNSGFPGSALRIVIDKDGHKWFSTSGGVTEFYEDTLGSNQ